MLQSFRILYNVYMYFLSSLILRFVFSVFLLHSRFSSFSQDVLGISNFYWINLLIVSYIEYFAYSLQFYSLFLWSYIFLLKMLIMRKIFGVCNCCIYNLSIKDACTFYCQSTGMLTKATSMYISSELNHMLPI